MSKFLTDLCLVNLTDVLWRLHEPLVYESDLLGCCVVVPEGFYTDLASVPRIPFAYRLWGGREHREAVIHDYLYCIDSAPVVSFMQANRVFLEAAKVREKSWWVRYPMFWGVCLGGHFVFHKRKVLERNPGLESRKEGVK